MNTRAKLVSEASQIPVGGSEDETAEKVKQLFKADKTQCMFKGMSAEDIKELDRQHKEEKDG